jgi:hypothetical protein
LNRALGRRPSIFDVLDDDLGTEPPPRDEGRDWHGAVELRKELDEASR